MLGKKKVDTIGSRGLVMRVWCFTVALALVCCDDADPVCLAEHMGGVFVALHVD
ncbi:MAG: hypothetical protein U5M23_08615 [Marinagarivorans sp.]|nr:hypothetical protein [Marinagarivorans sp.]